MFTGTTLSARNAAHRAWWTFGVLGVLLLCAGCASTGDPNDDTIFFNREKAERERIAPLTAKLRREQAGYASEQDRTRQLDRERAAGETGRHRDEARARELRARIADKKRELAQLDLDLHAARERNEDDARMIAERDARQAEIDRLTAMLKILLEMQ